MDTRKKTNARKRLFDGFTTVNAKVSAEKIERIVLQLSCETGIDERFEEERHHFRIRFT